MIKEVQQLEKVLGERFSPKNLLFFGTEMGRNLGLSIYARSIVSFKIPDNADFDRCLKDLRYFSSVLRVRKPTDVLYGWDSLFFSRKNRCITFNILWYNKDYFDKRNKAYKSILHEHVFRDFGISSDKIIVEHLI